MLVWIGVFTSNGREHVAFDTKTQCGDKLMGKQEITSIQKLLPCALLNIFNKVVGKTLTYLWEKPQLICGKKLFLVKVFYLCERKE